MEKRIGIKGRTRILCNFIIMISCAFLAVVATATEGTSAMRYASSTGSGSTCSSTAPCSASSAITASSAGDTVILYGVGDGYGTGTYSGNLTVNKAITVTTSPAVISALGTFNRGIPSGTDNRPYFSAAHISVTAGATLSYLRVRNASSPYDGAYDGVIGVSAEHVTIDHCEIWNGNQGVAVNVKRYVTVSDNYIHNLGSMSSGEDTHGVVICGGGGTEATSYSEGIYVLRNTITACGGDGVQEQTNCYCSGTFSYLTIDGNHIYNNQEQGFDSKGSRHVIISHNEFSGHGSDYGSVIATDPEDCNPPVMTDWNIYGNLFHDEGYGAVNQSNGDASNWKIYNNVFYNCAQSLPWNLSVVNVPDSSSVVYGNTFYNNTSSGSGQSAAVYAGGGTIKNNIFYNNGDRGAITGSGTIDYNYFNASGTAVGSHAVTTCYASGNCPGFVNIGNHDFHLLSGSPAKDAGTSLGSPYNVDFAGGSRPQGSAFDIGAYEYGGSAAPMPPVIINVQ